MNEFNPFKELGIDPNKQQMEDSTEPNSSVMWTLNQFNPFKELGINPNEENTQYNNFINPKDQEVTSMLWVDIQSPMTDQEKQTYVDSLSDEDRATWNKLKNEWYSFEARKTLMDNKEMLYDVEAEGSSKYFQSHKNGFVDYLTNELQSWLNAYQQNIAWFANKYDTLSNEYINADETDQSLWKKVANVANSLVSAWAHFLQGYLDRTIHKWLWVYNTALQQMNPTYEKVSWDANQDSYQSRISAALEMWTSALQWYVALTAPTMYTAFGIIGQDDWLMWQLVQKVDSKIQVGSDWLVDQVFKIPLLQEWIKQPGNEKVKDELSEGISYAIYAMLAWLFKLGWKWLGKTRAWIKMNEIKTKVSNTVNESLKQGKEAWDWMKWEMTTAWEVTPEWSYNRIAKTNIRNATIQWMKKWFREWLQEKKGLEIKQEPSLGLPEEKTTETEKIEVVPEQTKENTEIVKETEKLKLSEENRNNLATNPELQTAYEEVIKPYLETNWKENPEWIINQQVEDLVYDIKSGIDELYAQQANIDRSLNNKKLSQFEKKLIKEIEKIVNEKEPKTVLKKLWKLTPQQQWLMDKIYPNLSQKLTTINQIASLMDEITQRDLIWKILRFQAKRPRTRLTWLLKQQVYKYVSNYWDKQWVQYTIQDIDDFINWLNESEIKDLQDSKFSIIDEILDSMDNRNQPVWIRQGQEWDFTKSELAVSKKAKEEWYMPETNKYTVDENNKLTLHQTIDELDLKPADWWKTIREIFKEAWVNLTLPNNHNYISRYTKNKPNVAWLFSRYADLIALPEYSYAVWVLMHEFGHRVFSQLTDDESIKIISDLRRLYHLTDEQAEERFGEYMRNYFLYGNVEWKLSSSSTKEQRSIFQKEFGKDLWQKIFNTIEKSRNQLLEAFGAPNNRYITQTIDSIIKLKPKGKEMIQRDFKNHPEVREKFLEQSKDRLINLEKEGSNWNKDYLNKTPEQTIDLQFKESIGSKWLDSSIVDILKNQSIKGDVTGIRINDDGIIVWKYHWHEWPIARIMENFDEIDLDPELRQILEKQAEEWEQKQFEESLKNL